MKKNLILTLTSLILIFTGCGNRDHFLKDAAYRDKVEAQYEKQKLLGKNRWEQVFKFADQEMPTREREALKFILAYSSLSDIADYDGSFFLSNIRASFAARDTFSWGMTLPDVLFRHFVLPVRVNNENLDSSRIVFFAELKDRVRHMSMRDAVLEVNHWCHEKVTYRGTDERTSSPLATVRTAFGRCGEESTFTVAALRSVCIPARQCYTPRWAHSDDNHAWVEVWVDGAWHYIGACEPEPVLDAAWFTAPAKRAMLVNTNVFGDYEGPEDVLLKDERYTRINILPNYTKTKRIVVLVKDTAGKPADSAAVEFQLYNYAEFYPLLRTYTDSSGHCSFQTGLGDLMIWAAQNDRFAFRKASVKNIDTVILVLSMRPGREYSLQEDFVPPAGQEAVSAVTDSLKDANAKRLLFEDRMRNAYEQTFIDSSKAYRLAATLKLNADTLWRFLKQSRGNYRVLVDYAGSLKGPASAWLFPLLSAISAKDLRDVTFDVLMDNANNSVFPGSSGNTREVFCNYLLNPRVDNEWLRPYKSYLQQKFDDSFKARAAADPAAVVEWVRTNVIINNSANYGRAPLTPIGVYELKVADPHSRDIFFVALCRSLGIAARLEPGTRLPQYFIKDNWHDVLFDPSRPAAIERVKMVLESDPANGRNPEYYIHFTVEKFDGGFFRSLDYETDPRLKTFPCELELGSGYYMIVTGNRLKDGSVLSRISFFNLEAGKASRQRISLRKEPAPSVLGMIEAGKLETLLPQAGPLIPGNFVLAWMEPDKEPTKHFVADLKAKKKEFERAKCNIFFLFRNEKDERDFITSTMAEMPVGSTCLVPSGDLLKTFSSVAGQSLGSSLPVIAFMNKKGEILYISGGYRIGIGDDLLKLLH